MASLQKSKHLSLIDNNINDIWSLSLPAHLESLNLHGNYIHHICNLSHLSRLAHLDLSANQISVIDGFERLTSLKTLNLSCNLISVVDGLSQLRSLERLNLSYNQIEDVRGLSDLSGSVLHYIALHGNKLRSVDHLVETLKDVKALRSLVLIQDGSGNPLCHSQGYVQEVWVNLPQLHHLNNMDRNGRFNEEADISNIPGLEAYLDFLLQSEKVQVSESSTTPFVCTPTIDAVMENFKQKYAQGKDTSSSTSKSAVSSFSPSESGQHTRTTRKILKDKEFLSTEDEGRLQEQRFDIKPNTVIYGEPVKDKVENSKSKHSLEKSNLQSKREARSRVISTKDKVRNRSRQENTQQQIRSNVNAHSSKVRLSVGETNSAPLRTASSMLRNEPRQFGSDDNRRGREEAEIVYKDLLSTLETEKERRWKAEQAARRLADSLKDMQLKGAETETLKNSALEATMQLKQAVLSEHESNLTLNNEIRNLQQEVGHLKDNIAEVQQREERSKEALRAVEATLANKDTDYINERLHQNKKLQEAEQKASALNREVDILRHSLDASKAKIQQLQETLASRENQHREELRHRYSLNSPELQEVINEKIIATEQRLQSELIKQQEKVELLSRQYTQLEDEFRYALQVEEARFREIKAEFEQESSENAENKQMLLVAQRKDESSSKMIAELTALVKEQKGRIAELSKCKHEQNTSNKERIKMLEESLEEAKKQLGQMEALRQTKSKLQATVQAQESVIGGLKAERKLWGQELAQQGASLSQDRGRLEAKIEALNSEKSSLKKQLERESDVVKIKTKMIDDQTETIQKLKEAVMERDETVRTTREDSLSLQRSLEEQLGECKASLDETQELLDRANRRKDELKQEMADLQQELQESKHSHSALTTKWKEKSELIGHLEQQVNQMKNSWSQKEGKLTAERDAAMEQARQAMDRLRAADIAFRQQLEMKEAAFQDKISLLELEKLREIQLANEKVEAVEDEMRSLLQENDVSKKALENKMKKLTQALGDLQTDLL